MRRILSLLLVMCLLVVFCACSSRPAASNDATTSVPSIAPTDLPNVPTASQTQEPEADPTAEASQGIEVDENLLTVEVTIPASFFEDETAEEIQEGAKTSGMISCTINDDGSVTYKMTKAKHRELLAEMKAGVDDGINDLLNGDAAVASFKSITYNDDLTAFKVYVDTALYSDWDSFYAIAFYMLGGYYQAFSGVSSDDIDVIIEFIDEATNEVLDTASYKAFMEAG